MPFDIISYSLIQKKINLLAKSPIPRTRLEYPVSGISANINDLTFSKKSIYRYFGLADSRFTLHFDDFMIEYFYYEIIQEASPNITRSYNNGIFRADLNGGYEYYRLRCPYSYPVFGAILKILNISGDTGLAQVQCGLITADNSNRIDCIYDTDGNLKIEERIDNTNYTRDSITLSTSPKYILFAIIGKWAMVLHSSDGINWIYGTRVELSQDIREDSTRNSFYPYFGGGGSAGYYEIDYVKFFIPLSVGYRDIKIVTDIYGNPIYINGKYYFTATSPTGIVGEIPGSYLSILSFDSSSYKIEPVGILFTNRDGKTLPDHAGHLIYDPRNGKWILLVSGWGSVDTIPIKTYKGFSYENLLYGVHVLPVTLLDLPTINKPYDPSLVMINNKYYLVVAYHPTSSEMYSYLFESTDMVEWTYKSSYTEANNEGPTFSKVGNTWYIVASKGTNTMVVLNFPDLTEVRTISVDTGHPNPWGGIFPLLKDSKTKYYLIVMDNKKTTISGTDLGSFTWGGLHIYESDQSYDGYEFNILNI